VSDVGRDDLDALFRSAVTPEEVAELLHVVASPPNRRDDPEEGDLEGEWDFWFDGGAGSMETGGTRIALDDGTVIRSGGDVPWRLAVEIRFPDGRAVEIRQTAPPLGGS